MTKKQQTPPLEAGLLSALKALDNQIAREMQRSPAEREELGVSKSEPIAKRVETVTGILLDGFEADEVGLDSIVISAQALTKALSFIISDLGLDGLGEMRAGYCKEAIERIGSDLLRARQGLSDEATVM